MHCKKNIKMEVSSISKLHLEPSNLVKQCKGIKLTAMIWIQNNHNLGHNILKLYNLLGNFPFFTSKVYLNIYLNKHNIQVVLRLKILEVQEISQKDQNWLQIQSSVQSSIQKQDFCNPLCLRNTDQSFPILSNFD